jgi:hypothetical protein
VLNDLALNQMRSKGRCNRLIIPFDLEVPDLSDAKLIMFQGVCLDLFLGRLLAIKNHGAGD